jgi:ankyrin repeat protein
MTISSLVVAAHEGFDDIVTLLLKFGANIETTDPAGSRALHWAVKNDHPDTVRLLLSHGAEIDPLGPANLTPLQSAAMDNQVQMAELLIEKGADVNAIGQNGKTAMMLSIHEENLIPMWQLLVDNGARLDLVDYSESTVLDQARRLGHTKAVSFLCQVLGIKELRDTTF